MQEDDCEPDLVSLVEADTGPVHHATHCIRFMIDQRRLSSGLSEEEHRLVLKLPGNVHRARHLPPRVPETGQQTADQSPRLHGQVSVSPPWC